MHGRTYKTGGKDSIMEKDPEIAVITALCAILELNEWKSLSTDGKKRCLEYFAARRSDEEAFKGLKPAPEKHKFIEEAAKKYIDWTKDLPKPGVLGPGEDDYGRKPRPPFDITCKDETSAAILHAAGFKLDALKAGIPLPPSSLNVEGSELEALAND